MQALMTMSDAQLDRLMAEKERRACRMATVEGKKESQIWALRLIDYLINSGYKPPDAAKDRVAVVYADQLSDVIVTFGCDELQKVVREWVRNDNRPYKAFPTAGDILDAVKKMLGNPAAEVARRKYEQEVQRIVERERAALMDGASAEEVERIERRYKHE